MFGSPEGTTWEWQHQGTINFGRWVLAQHSISNCQDTLCKALENPEHYEHIIVWPQFCVMKLCGSTLSRLKPFDPCNFGLHNRDPNVAGRYIPVVWFTFSSLFGAHLGEPIPMRCWHCWGPRWLSQVVWENRLKHRLGYKGEALPHPLLSEICAAMHLRSFTTEGARCDLWFESARISLPALGVWNLLNVYMHGWFYYMIVGDTAFYNAHDKVIAVNSM
jgi:hypothetical protein